MYTKVYGSIQRYMMVYKGIWWYIKNMAANRAAAQGNGGEGKLDPKSRIKKLAKKCFQT